MFTKSSASHELQSQIKKHMPYLSSRGVRITKQSDQNIILEDLDEWKWNDSSKLHYISKNQLIIDIFSSASANTDEMNGIIVCVTIIESGLISRVFQMLTSIMICVVFFLWIQYVHTYKNSIFFGDSGSNQSEL